MRALPLCVFLFSPALFAAPDLIESESDERYLIRNAHVLTMTERGAIENGEILIVGKHIAAVGQNLKVEGSVAVIDARGAIVTPGLFDSGTQLGLAEVRNFAAEKDDRVIKQNLGAGFSISLALNRYSSLIPMVRKMGVTRAMVVPVIGSELLAGQSAIVQLGDKTPFATDKSNAVHLYLREVDRKFAGGSRASALAQVVSSLKEAQRYARNIKAYQAGKTRDFRQSEADLQALSRVLRRDMPLVIHIDRAADIETVLAELSDFECRIVLAGAREGWKVKQLLVENNIPVLLNVIDNLPSRFDRLGARLDNAALLVEAGVTVAFMTEDLFGASRLLTQGAGIAVAYGLAWEDALKAITTNPASIWGIENVGSLKPGAVADIVIWDGDPLEVMSAPSRLMIDGVWINLRTRQDMLRERYSDLSNQDIPYGYR